MVNRALWTNGNLTITRAALEQIDEEARQAYARDEESCGVLGGPLHDPLHVDFVVPMENRANKLHAMDPETYPRTGRMYFDLDPRKFAKYVDEYGAKGTPIKVLYHSHLDVGAYFSATDAEAAMTSGSEPTYELAYLVTSVRSGVVDDRKLFVFDRANRAFVETPLCVK